MAGTGQGYISYFLLLINDQEPFFQDSPVLENATIKFQNCPGFPGPVQTLTGAGMQKKGRGRERK